MKQTKRKHGDVRENENVYEGLTDTVVRKWPSGEAASEVNPQ